MKKTLQGTLRLPGDKSISHRALMFNALAKGEASLYNLSTGQDVQSTRRCLEQLGCQITDHSNGSVRVHGGLARSENHLTLDCGNSGTTMRLLSGILCGFNQSATLVGDASLSKRPMKRVIDPLQQMGAYIQAENEMQTPPLSIATSPQPLKEITYTLPVPSAQIKSAILLAGLFTEPEQDIAVIEPIPSRDHTERMFTAMGTVVEQNASHCVLRGRQEDLLAQSMTIPGDMSSAAFWLVGAAILPGSDLCLEQVSLNPYRTGILDCLKPLGLKMDFENQHVQLGEPSGDIRLRSDRLTGDINISEAMVPRLIDEIPILTILGLFTNGVFTVRGAEELRYKEADRLGALVNYLKQLGVDVTEYPDGFSFQGNSDWVVPTVTNSLETFHDHRLVMALEILNLRATQPLPIEGREWVSISYPGFYGTLNQLIPIGS